MAAPGDIRSCLQSLANCEPLMAQLMAYRFADGTLAGQSLGNLLLAALNDIMPSFDKAVAGLSKVLAITGRVLPVTNENVQLEATFENGATVLGESHIFYCKKEQDCRIQSVRLLPEHPKALDAAEELEATCRLYLTLRGLPVRGLTPEQAAELLPPKGA